MNKKTVKINKVYAFYLPQYHPIKENDEWWGKGFTEWTNVTKSKPRYRTHRQPQLPADLGFYDLRLPESRVAQAEMAKHYGVDGFIYYHYWFHGKRLINRPIDEMIQSKSPDFPFALCWANETWTRAWDGQDREILAHQEYSIEDHGEHCDFITNMFLDERYIKIDGKPLFLIYRAGKIKHLDYFLEKLSISCKRRGLMDPYICAVRSSFGSEYTAATAEKFDGVVDFQPNSDDFPKGETIFTKVVGIAKEILPGELYQYLKIKGKGNKIISYKKLVDRIVDRNYDYHNRVYPCVFPSWDNSPRRDTPTIIQNDHPDDFGRWLKHAKIVVASYPESEQLIFVNAWNEWAEGCHLEPDQQMGHVFLQQLKDTFS